MCSGWVCMERMEWGWNGDGRLLRLAWEGERVSRWIWTGKSYRLLWFMRCSVAATYGRNDPALIGRLDGGERWMDIGGKG